MEAETVGIEDQLSMFGIEYNDGDADEFGVNPTEKASELKAGGDLRALKRDRRIVTRLTKPCTTLVHGSKGNLSHQNRIRLRYLLNKLVKRRNWSDAAGVLSVLLKGTCKERSLHDNRIKYSVAMELLGHVESDRAYSKNIEDLYDLWMKKIRPKKNRPWRDRFVLFDSVISFLMQKNYDGARSCALSLRQDREVDNDPISNLILGLCYYELWYTTLPEDRQLIDLQEPEMLDEIEESSTELHTVVANSEDYQAVSIQDTNSSFKYQSETSVMNDKVIQMDHKDSVPYADQRVRTNHQSQVQGLYINSDQSGSEGGSLMKRNTNMQGSSAFYSHGVPDNLLFPIKWDPLNENIEDVLKELHPNDDYKDAVEYLRKALNSTPGVEEALLPLVQILLLNDRVKEALDELEKYCYASKSLFASRLKTHYFECLGCNNHELLFSYYEDILKKDPTCKHSIEKLVRAYQMGDYDPERLLEMIALHLDATFADHEIWREFASCLLKVSQFEEDRVSTCLNGDVGERSFPNTKIPAKFLKGVLGKNWKLRCKWWLNRHFNKKLLASEMAGGDLFLMAHKAACASQMYGPGLHYVVKVGTILKEAKDPLFMILNTYVQSSSSGFYSELSGGSKGIIISSWKEVFSCVVMTEEEKTTDKERGGNEGDKSVRKKGRPKADENGKRKRGRPRKEEKCELDGGSEEEAECVDQEDGASSP